MQPSVSGEDSSSNLSDKTAKSRDKRIRNKQNVDANTSGENYVWKCDFVLSTVYFLWGLTVWTDEKQRLAVKGNRAIPNF